MSKTGRAGRNDQFLKSEGGTHGFLSPALINSATSLLAAALHERRHVPMRLADTHPAETAVGAFALFVTALDVWVSESFDGLARCGVFSARQIAAGQGGIAERYRWLTKEAGAAVEESVHMDLALPAEVRHDVIHHLPRPVVDKGNVPAWLEPLRQRGLFLSRPEVITLDGGGTKEIDLVYCDQLRSYKLAYWGFELAERAATALADALPARFRGFVGDTTQDFMMYRSEALAPTALARYDAEYDLALTI